MANNSKKYVSLSKLSTFLDNLKNNFADTTHEHTMSDITDYKVDTELSSTSSNPVQNKVLDAEFEAISEAMNALEASIDDKADSTHNHDNRYYTETEIDSKVATLNTTISGKANSSHTHDDRYYTETEVDDKLAEKADSGHTHTISDVTNLQSSLDAKVSTSRKVNGKALTTDITLSASDVGASESGHNHDTKYDTKGAAAAVQTNLDTVSDELDTHTSDTDIHVTTSNKTNWNTAYTHSQSTHARTDATKVADSTTNGNILINGTETNVYSHPNSGVTAGTYKSVTVNAQGHITGGTNPTTLAGYGITDAESKGAASSALADAKEYTDTVASGKADTSHNHDSKYDAKGAASSALASAKEYADSAATTAANTVKNDLLNGAGTAYDTLKELGDLIDDNADAIDALETVAAGKADKTHSHAIADVSGLQTALDGKAASSHGTHVSYSTTAPVMDGTASAGSASTVARSDHKHPTDTSRASKTEFDTHTANTTAHITSTERSNWNAAKTHADSAHAPSNAEKNQNAFSNITVGSTTVAADTATDTVTFVGSNVTITPDATNDKITFAVADGSTSAKGIVKLTNSTSSTSTTTAATPSSVKSAYDLANTAKTNAATAQTKADSAYTLAESKVDSLSDLGITATAAELNYVDGVTSNIQTQLDGKAASSHTHSYAGSSSAGGAATSANKVNSSLTVKLNGGSTEGTNLFTFNGSAAKSVNITPSAIGAAASSHTHDDRYYTETEIDTKLSGKANTSHGNHVPATQTANNATFLRNDNTWQKVTPANIGAAASSHTHTVANITDLTATATELNYMDGVTSNVQTQLDGKAASSHNHSAANITSGTIAAARLPVASGTSAGVTIVYPAASCTTFSSDSGTVTPLAVQKGAKMFAITRPSATTNKAIARYSNTTGDVQDSKILIEDVTNTRDTSKTANVLSIPAEGGKKMVYGYCTDQVDGTSFIGGVFDADATEFPYAEGLAIGGTSGNLLWKGARVATATDLDGKQATITGGASTITSSNLTANRALISNGSGKVAVSAVTSTELGYLDGVTSNIQTQLDAKPDTSDLGFVRKVTCTSSDGVTYTGTTDGITALTAGLTIVFVSSKTSASKTPTLNINSLGAKSIKRRLSHLSTTTQEGYSTTWLYANKPYLLIYDGTQWIVDGLTKPSAADLYGTPAAATKATQDASGNVITDTYATKASIPTTLKNPYALTFTGGVTGTYDGSAAKTVNIPTASSVAEEVVVLLKTSGDVVVGAVDSDKNILLAGDLADAMYTLKYQNSDGTTTTIGTLKAGKGYKDVAEGGTWYINKRINSSFQLVDATGYAVFVSQDITGLTEPSEVHIKFSSTINLLANNMKEVWIAPTGAYQSYDYDSWKGSKNVTKDANGDWTYRIGYKLSAEDSTGAGNGTYVFAGSGSYAYSGIKKVGFSIQLSSSAITNANLPTVNMAINELIVS